MHAATIDRSSRLQRLRAVLLDRKPHSTRDLMRRAHICAVSACVSELRANGMNIACKRRGGIWYYFLAS